MALAGTVWRPIGPSPLTQSGRQDNGLVTAVAVNPNNGNVVYIGTAGGGVWRTPDGGANWVPIFDRQTSLGIGEPSALAIDPNDTSTIYMGTSGRVGRQISAGLFKSTDGGASCVRLGSGYPVGNNGNASQFTRQWINVILVDPANSQTLYLASTTGVFRSTDGGLNWTFGAGAAGDARSLVLDPTSSAAARVLYTGISGRGVFRSTDGGLNWNAILDTATAPVAAALAATPGAGIGKVIVDLAPPTSPPNANGIQVIYVALEGRGGSPTAAPDPLGLFLSTDRGANWTQQVPASAATAMPANTQGGYSFHMAVDPGSPGDGANDIVYVGTVGQGRSTDAGRNFNALTGLHADTHTWAFFRPPGGGVSTVYCGNDGGIYRSANGTNWTALNSGGFQSALFYNLAVRPDATASVTLGSLQDNGLLTTAGVASPAWNSPQGGDGWDIAYDGVTAGRAYGTSGFWSPAPCTRVWRSDDDGASWPTEITPWGTTSDAGCYLAWITTDPSAAGTVYVSGNQNMWQSQNAGGAWRNLGAFPGVPAVAPTNGNNVVIASGTQVWVTTNALAATVGAPNGVTFTNITRNLPNRNVLRAAFDPIDPSVIYVVLGGFNTLGQTGHIFRTTVGGTAWEDLSPDLDVPFGAIALDGSDTPTTIYVGTDLGVLRSVDDGASWTVLDDIHLPRASVTELVLSRQGGILRAATYGRGVFEFRNAAGPAITVNLEQGLDFGTVCEEGNSLTVQVFNVGGADLVITSVRRLMGSTGITVSPLPATPVIIRPGEELDFTVRFLPTTPGISEMATIRIDSNDPGAPVVDLTATGTGGVPSLQIAVPDTGQFGNVCLGSFVDRSFALNNRGPCDLQILSITSSTPDFVPPGVLSYPLVVEAGDSIELPIRFQPNQFGPVSSTITVHSNDPTGPITVVVSGTAPPPVLAMVVPDNGDFGEVRLGRFTDRDLVINNSGPCELSITGIVSSAPIFVIPQVVSFPLTVDGGDSIAVPIRFQPTNRGSASATLTIVSNDPNSPAVVNVSGTAWPPLPVAGTTLEGFRLSTDSQHVFFVGTDKYVHELDIAAGGIWNDNDLTTLAGAVPPIPTSALAGFPLSTDTKHVFFIGTDGCVYELYFTAGTSWVYNDLTSLARAVPPIANSALAGHRLNDNSKHVFFIGTDNHVHELFIAGGGRWADNDLTVLAGATPPKYTSALTSYRLSDDSQHVFFIGTDNHVHELFINGGSWADNDLTALAGAVPPTPTSALTGYPLSDDSQHVFFIGTDNHVHELFINGGSWADNDLTALAGAVPPTPTSALTGYPLSNNSQHVFFIGTDSHVHELDINGGSWGDNDLTTLAGAVPPTPASALTGYRLSDNSKHVFFIGTDDHVHELYFHSGADWVDNDLTALT